MSLSKVVILTPVSAASLLLGGCAFSPSIPMFGAAFPDWLLCMVPGVIGTVFAHLALSRRGKSAVLAPNAITYPALAAVLSMAFWLIFFSR